MKIADFGLARVIKVEAGTSHFFSHFFLINLCGFVLSLVHFLLHMQQRCQVGVRFSVQSSDRLRSVGFNCCSGAWVL